MSWSTPARARRPSWPDPWRCTVEVLVVSGCPGTELTIARIRQATDALGIETNVRFVIVDGEEQARALSFPGSPTVRVEGRDVEDESPVTARGDSAEGGARDEAGERPVGVWCRLYRTGDTVEQAPPLAMIQAALERAASLLGKP